MANIEDIFDTLMKLEFNSPKNALHWNKNEKGYTFMGIYQVAHPKWIGWNVIGVLVDKFGREKASEILYKDEDMLKLVKDFYYKNFWRRMRLDEVEHQQVANEMFIFGVNAGCKAAVRLAQEVVGVTKDGLIGPNTIRALNKCNPEVFDVEYDKKETEYYEGLIAKNPSLKIYANGWRNRALLV